MFELIWQPVALDELSDIYVGRLSVAERETAAVAVERLNRDLADDPFEVGESREGPMRIVLTGGLTIYFTVVAYAVRVIRVHRRT